MPSVQTPAGVAQLRNAISEGFLLLLLLLSGTPARVSDALARVAKAGKPMTRDNVRDAIQATNLKTLQGDIAFDDNGDTLSKVVSIYQVKTDTNFPPGDVVHQFKYVGVAPET